MLKIQEIREIIKLIDQSSIEKFTYEVDGAKIKLVKGNTQQNYVENSVPTHQAVQPVIAEQSAPKVDPVVEQVSTPSVTPATEIQVEDPALHKIVSPMVGTFYAASSPDVPAFVKLGDKVTAESIVCIVEAMKLFNEIEAEISGEIVEILVKDGQLIEYGQPLFLVKAY